MKNEKAMSLASIFNWNLFVLILKFLALLWLVSFVLQCIAAIFGFWRSVQMRIIGANKFLLHISGLIIYLFITAPYIDIQASIQSQTPTTVFESFRQKTTFGTAMMGQFIHAAICLLLWKYLCINIESLEKAAVFEILVRTNEAFYFGAYKYINGLPPQSVYDKNRVRANNNTCSICNILFNRTTLETILACGDKFHRGCLRLYESRRNKWVPSFVPRCPVCVTHYQWLQKWTYQYPERDDIRQTGLMGTVPTDIFNVVDQFCVSQN
eukprot:472791_1